MKIQYETFNLRQKTLDLIEQANEIIEEYQAQGFMLTVRQIYYQFIARDLLPEEWKDPRTGSKNNFKSYGKVNSFINSGRLTGLIDWWAIEDRTRFLRGNIQWNSVTESLQTAASSYRRNSRETQDYLVEVWIEKDALVGMIDSICRELDVDFFACRGYVSLSEMWRAAQRIQQAGKCVILHLGDHDPSGIDMTRVIQTTLNTFGCEDVEVRRIALTMKQVKKYDPPPCPAKLSDSRAKEYIATYGDESWELDALAPNVIKELIRSNVEALTDQAKREVVLDEQEQEKGKLEHIAENWEELVI